MLPKPPCSNRTLVGFEHKQVLFSAGNLHSIHSDLYSWFTEGIQTSMSILGALPQPTSATSWWSILVIWVVAIASVSLLLRNHVFPWLLARLSKHLRVRSVSLWSIRGLYLRTATQTWRIDRIGYGWSNGFNVKLHGLSIELSSPQPTTPVTPLRRHNRRLTLADLSPTPLVHRALSELHSLFEP